MRTTDAIRFFAAAATTILFGSITASAQEILKIEEGGALRNFTLVEDEVLIEGDTENGERLKDDVQAAIPGASVIETRGAEALTKLPQRVDRRKAAAQQEAVQINAPQYKTHPVLYRDGLPRTIGNRRYVGQRVLVALPEGKTADQLGAESGALKAEVSKLPGHALLTFSDGWQSLSASDGLKAKGLNARPLLRKYAEKMFVPNDPYLPDQWHLRNRGQSGGLVGADANLYPAWDLLRADSQPVRGQGVTVVVVDDSLQTTHPDLSPNTPPVSSNAHIDFRSGGNNPGPKASDDAHGTSVSGVIAAKGHNGIGVTGAAPDAQLLGVRLIGGFFDAQTTYDALNWEPAGFTSSVSNNSWGYGSVGMVEIDPLEKQAMLDATTKRGGLGQVTLFAAANNDDFFNGFDLIGNPIFTFQDSNYQPFSSSRFVIGVAANTNYGDHSYYSNRGASVLISAPSNGGSLGIFTTDNVGSSGYNSSLDPGGQPSDKDYTNSFGGTSSATPLTSGIVALMLSANSNLGYRDVMEILATTAVKIDASNPDWVQNGAGFDFAHAYGAGMVNAAAAVARSLQWQNLGAETSLSRSATSLPAGIPDNSSTTVSRTFDFSNSANLRVEHVEVVIAATHPNRSDLEIAITSPAGTRSILNPIRPRPDVSYTGDDDNDIGSPGNGWVFMTTHHWGENSSGQWTVTARDGRSGSTGTLDSLQVRVYGTPANQQRVRFAQKSINVDEIDGSADLVIERLGPTTGTVQVSYAIVGGTATQGVDFTLTNGTVFFAPGETQKIVPVAIADDATPEGPESVYIALTNPVGATLGGGTLCSLIIEPSDGNFVTIRATDAEAAETPDGPQAPPANRATFAVSRLFADVTPLIVPYTVAPNGPGIATPTADYTGLSGTVTIPAGLDTAFITLTPKDDPLFEGPETVTVRLTDPGPTGDYELGDPSEATATIKDDEIQKVGIAMDKTSLPENGSQTADIIVSRNNSSTEPLTVSLLIAGSAQPGLDYVALPDSVTIPGGQGQAILKLQPKDNEVYNPVRTVAVVIAPTADYQQDFKKEVQARLINDEPPPDLKKPSVTVTSPKPKQRFPASVPTLTAAGLTRDNLAVDSVQFRVNGGDWFVATMPNATTWTADVLAQSRPGPNLLEVRAKDGDGNFSAVVSRPFTLVQERTLTVNVLPEATVGTVSAPKPPIEAGQTYTLKAKPATGKIFAGWSGDLTGSNKVLTFIMPNTDPGTTVNATFVDNPFSAAVVGRYTGLVNGPTSLPAISGMIDIVISGTGVFTGKLWYGGVAFPLKGEFSGAGLYEGTVKRTKKVPLSVRLSLDLNPTGTLSITGVIDGDAQPSSVLAHRAGYDKNHPADAQLARAYTFYIPPTFPADPSKPHGNGVGTVNVSRDGVVKWTGFLGDGTPATQTTVLNGQNRWPLYVSLYKGTGYASGQVTHDTVPAGSDLSASLNWVKEAAPKDKTFPDGFTIEGSSFIGVEYTPPPTGTRVLPGYDTAPDNSGPLTLVDGNLPATIAKVLKLAPNNATTITGLPTATDKLKISIAAKTGIVNGSFIFPLKPKATQVKGVILQNKIGKGVGFFLGNPLAGPIQSGRLEFYPATP